MFNFRMNGVGEIRPGICIVDLKLGKLHKYEKDLAITKNQ